MSYVTTVLADAPDHFWRMADPGGYLAHDIGAAPTPLWAASAAATLGYSGPNSDGGSALALPNPVQYFQTIAAIQHAASFSVELWVWTSGVYGGAAFFLMGWDGASANGPFIQLQANNKLAANQNGVAALDPAVLTFNAWHHIVVTYANGGNLILYKDAVNVGQVACPAVGAQTLNFLLGRRSGAGNLAEAAFSEVAAYPAVLTPARVTAHFVAADNVASRPVIQTPAVYNNSTGGVTQSPQEIADIRAAVIRTFPTT